MEQLSMKSLLILFTVIGCCAGQDILPKGPLDAVLGKNATFTTLLKPNEKFLTLSWNFNDGTNTFPVLTVVPAGPNVNDAYKGRVSVNASTGSFTLGPLESKDSGDYAMTMVASDGTQKTGEIGLRVLEPVSDVVIASNVTEAVEFNSTVQLTCSAKGSFLKFTWTNKTAPIVADGKRIKLTEEESSSTLAIADVLRSELSGPIYCKAANKLETEMSAPFNLTVSYGPDKVDIQRHTPVVRSGTNITLLCSAESSPPASFMWYHNGALSKLLGPKIQLMDIKEKEGGNYSCMAHNAKTLRYVSSEVISLSVQEPITGVQITGPTATLIAGNNGANLSCQAAGGTVKTRAWMKDNMPLSLSNRVMLSEDKSTVMIKTVEKEDNGEYKCELRNDVTTESATYKMVVNYGPDNVKVEAEKAVEVTDPVKLMCTSMSVPPATYTWKFNGTMTPVTTPRYTIEKAVYKNTGMYTCEAHNAVTGKNATNSHFLSVQEEGSLDGLSDGAIAGIIIAVLLGLGAAIGAVLYCRRKQTIESPY